MFRKMHLRTGIVFLVLFLLSGFYMVKGFPGLYGQDLELRMMYRANHIYILMGALINLLFAYLLYESQSQKFLFFKKSASLLILLAPFLLLAAFFADTQQLSFNRPFTFLGIVCLTSGVLLIAWITHAEKRKRSD